MPIENPKNQQQNLLVPSRDNKNLSLVCWGDSNTAKYAIHILHGMAEHKLRYQPFAHFLNQHDCIVYAHDHRGHGDAAALSGTLGHFADKNGFQHILDDIHSIQQFIQKKHQNLPIFIIAHSMGSFIVQSYLLHYPLTIKGLILTGTALNPPFLARALYMLASLEKLRLGGNKTSKLLNFLTFSTYNNAFKPNRTEFDWLSRNNTIVDDYIADPLCGFICSTESWRQLASALVEIGQLKNFVKVDKNLPLFIICGDKDPVGSFGKAARALEKFWHATGQKNITFHLLTDARHEVLNEIDNQKTYNEILNWIQTQSATS